jgi:hypothetical protein
LSRVSLIEDIEERLYESGCRTGELPRTGLRQLRSSPTPVKAPYPQFSPNPIEVAAPKRATPIQVQDVAVRPFRVIAWNMKPCSFTTLCQATTFALKQRLKTPRSKSVYILEGACVVKEIRGKAKLVRQARPRGNETPRFKKRKTH